VADHDDLVALLVQARHLQMHLGHQRTGGVEHLEPAPIRLDAHRLRHAMGAENHRCAVRHLGQFLDEHGALGLESVDHVAVVYHFMPHVDWRAELFQRAFDDGDRAFDAGAEAAGVGQDSICITVSL
jgi:hypothetical protein